MVFYIPTPNLSVSDLTRCLEKAVKYNYIKKEIKHVSEGPLKSILDYTEDQVVSWNFNSDANFSTFYAGTVIALNNFVDLTS